MAWPDVLSAILKPVVGLWVGWEEWGSLEGTTHPIPAATATTIISSGAQVLCLIVLRLQEHYCIQG